MRAIDVDALMAKLGIGQDCSICKYDDTPYCCWKPDVVDVCEAICDAPTIEPEPHWIPCSERLPDVGAILINDGNQMFIGAYYGNNTWSADGCDYDPILENIAWMPLPEPYREGE